MAGNPGENFVLYKRLVTAVAGQRFQGAPATLGEQVQLVREPDNAADRNAIAVHAAVGRRLGYLSREIAADYGGLMDLGLVQLSGELAAPCDPDFDEHRASVNPTLFVWIYVDPGRLNAFLARSA
jgi:hypothetical protein